MENLGNEIRKLRRGHELSQNQLGQLLGCSANTVLNWERGASHPNMMLLFELDKVFGGTLLDSPTVRPWACGGGA